MKKEFYTKPEIQISSFKTVDTIITTSTETTTSDDNFEPSPFYF